MPLSPPELILKSSICTSVVKSSTYFYSLCKKQGNTISLLSNWRILIFDETSSSIYYVNEPPKTPFQLQNVLSKPKNQVVDVLVCVVKHEKNSKNVSVTYNKKNGEGKDLTLGEWTFAMQSQDLASQWQQLIRDKKQQKTAGKLGISRGGAKGINVVTEFVYTNQGKKVLTLDEKQEEDRKLKEYLLNSYNSRDGKGKMLKQSQVLQQKQGNVLSQSWNLRQETNKNKNMLRSQSKNQSQFINDVSIEKNRESDKMNRTSPPINVTQKPNVNEKNQSFQLNKSIQDSLQMPNLKKTKSFQKQIAKENLQPSKLARPDSKQILIIENSRNSQNSQISQKSRINQSRSSRNQDNINDWNQLFIEQRSQLTVERFTKAAIYIFLSSSKTKSFSFRTEGQKQKDSQAIKYQKNGINFIVAQRGSKQAINIKRQFKNYHYLLQSLKQNTLINVPLCCLISYLGIVCLAKAKYSNTGQFIKNFSSGSSQVNQNLRKLQAFTHISSQNIKKSSTLIDLTQQYGTSDGKNTIFVDNLIQYLPEAPETVLSKQTIVRPEIFQKTISSVVNPNTQQFQSQIQQILNDKIKNLSQLLSDDRIIIASYKDLKSVLHSYCLNMQILPKLYLNCKSKLTKRFIHTAMLARIIKRDILRTLNECRQSKQQQNYQKIIEEAFRIYLQDKDQSNLEVWKNLSHEFKKVYRCVLNFYQIQGAFLLGSLMQMIEADYNVQTIDRSVKFFEGKGIINIGFVVNLRPKVKTFDILFTKSAQQALELSQSPNNNIQKISRQLNLNQCEFELSDQKYKQILTHFSKNLSPKSADYPQIQIVLSTYINEQPPTLTSHKITLNFLKFCLLQNSLPQYKKTIQKSVQILSYWVCEDHPLLSEIFESLSEYYHKAKGKQQQSINYMKQALTTCIRATTTHCLQTGLQHFKLGEKLLLFGEKDQARDSFTKAKMILENNQYEGVEYVLLLLKMGTLQLNANNLEKGIKLAILSIKAAEDKNIDEQIVIKSYELLCRIYELNGNKGELLNLGHLAAKVFNTTENQYVFCSMMKICVVGFLMALNVLKQEKVIQFIKYMQKRNKNQQRQKSIESINKLMQIANRTILMQKFNKIIENIQKNVSQMKTNKILSSQTKQNAHIFQLIINCLSLDFFTKTLQQAKYF